MARNCGGRALRPLVSELEKIRMEREQYSLDPQNQRGGEDLWSKYICHGAGSQGESFS